MPARFQTAYPPIRRFVGSSVRRRPAAAFTLLELLLALSIFSVVAAMAAAAFWSVTKSFNRSTELLEQLHYGEFAMDQLVASLRSAAWFSSKPEAFGFWLEPDGGTASWVSSGSAFLPPDSPYRNGLHRLSVSVERIGRQHGLAVRVFSHLAEDPDPRDADPFLAAPNVRDFECEWYDFEDENWSHDWEQTNSLPKLVRLTLTMDKREGDDTPLKLCRVVELEVAPDLPGRESSDRTTVGEEDRREREEGDGDNPVPPPRRPGHDDGDRSNKDSGSRNAGNRNSGDRNSNVRVPSWRRTGSGNAPPGAPSIGGKSSPATPGKLHFGGDK